MKEPTRLVDGHGDPYLRDLLESASIDEPEAATFARAIAGVAAGSAAASLVAANGGAAVHASTSVTAAGKVVAKASFLPAKAASVAALTKWLGAGALAGAIASSAVVYVSSRIEPRARESNPILTAGPIGVPRRAAATAAANAKEARPKAPVDEGTEPEAAETTPVAPVPPKAVQAAATPSNSAFARRTEASPSRSAASVSASLATAREATESATSTLQEEVSKLDRARAALAGGDDAAALRALDDYAASCRTHVLDREATIVRIDALVASGQAARAAELARRYLSRYPDDSHATRLREISEGR